ncbi:MAG: hypothetical protein U9Q33_00600 [Campylobacterota bacterium]|nr:hypothetical protein [Campylobacterota bacterium]
MKTISVQIQDSYVSDFMNYINNHSENITISKDKNLELDPYFYERQKELHQLREDIKNGDMEMLSQEQYDKEMKQFLEDLKK